MASLTCVNAMVASKARFVGGARVSAKSSITRVGGLKAKASVSRRKGKMAERPKPRETGMGAAAKPRGRTRSAGPPAPPKPVAEPDEAAHKEATAEMQASIDEIEKRVVRAPCSCFRAACGVMCRSDMAAKRVSAMLTGAAASCLPAPAVETLGRS